jgi:PAS domain S-box-containing protein
LVRTAEKLANFKTIYCSPSSIIYRAFDTGNNRKVIVKTLNRELYDPKTLAKLKNEFRLLEKLQGDFVVRTYEFVNIENHFSIVMEDFGGISLDQYLLSNRIDIMELLQIALKIVQCLDHIHNQNVIHNDINPSNIVYNPISKKIKLIDFGNASEFSFETRQALHPNKLEGRLPYISPEQTGRMNRPVDYRTDFYSLGISLYELACRRLPLVSENPAEIMHFHIAKIPVPAHEINPRIPKRVSAIISKLMAKMPEDRYKNARGIAADIQNCITQMENGHIQEFDLGRQDIATKFEVPKKLYGRDNEVKKLLACYTRSTRGKTEFVLIGGYSGSGKTRLVNELHKPITQEQGIFISGKYDQYNRNNPYSACFQAIDQFCQYILGEPEIKIKAWRERILPVLGLNGRLLTDKVPRLKLIIGEQPVLGEMTPIEEQTRFKLALKNWLTVISSPEHPVVFFMDDIQWADTASLDLFESLVIDEAITGLMFVGTYRDNEVNAAHPLLRTIDNIKEYDGQVEFIKLDNLTINDITRMLADITSRPEPEVQSLAELVHDRTLGNPFYTIGFLKHCYQENLLYYDREAMSWQWTAAGILNSPISDNVADYLIDKIDTLPEACSGLIKLAACIGNQFPASVLAAVAGKDVNMIRDNLKPAILQEMVYVAGNKEDVFTELQFEFCHDKFQQAGYQALPEEIKKATHLKIARYYEYHQNLEGEYLFAVADHYSKALDCLGSPTEIEHVIDIFFKASRAATLSSAYDTARMYLELIIDIAPEYLKNNTHFLLRLYSEYHLVLFSLARFEELDRVYTRIEELVTDPLDLVDCCCLQLISLSNRSRNEEGFLLGIALLEKLGIKYPQDNLAEVIEEELAKYRYYEKNGSIEQIDKRKMLTDKKGKAIAKLLNRIVPTGQLFNPQAAFWAALVSSNFIIEHGPTGLGLETTWPFFMGVIAYQNDFHCGSMMAQKAVEIAVREGFNAELYRMQNAEGLVRCHWFNPLEKAIHLAHESFKGNLQNGEFEFSCFSFFTSLTAILESCHTVSELEEELEAALAFANKMGNLYALQSYVSFEQMIKALRGETSEPGSFNDIGFSEAQHIQGLQKNGVGMAFYYTLRSLSAVLFGDFELAFILTEKAFPFMPFVASFYPAALIRFLHSLSICRMLDKAESQTERQSLQLKVTNNQQWMYERAQHAPFNFQHLYDLVEAELTVIGGRYDEAFRLYEKAINLARENNRPYHRALACEIAGQRCYALGVERIAAFYLKEAYSLYLAWGATGKVEYMQQKYPQLVFSGVESAGLAETLGSWNSLTRSSIDINDLTNRIDLNAIILATQAISGEIEKRKLLQTLMRIIIENSGSSRGYILVKDQSRWILSAYEVTLDDIGVIIDEKEVFPDSVNNDPVLPFSVINYVIRSAQPLIIDNIKESQFAKDSYYSASRALSAMCFSFKAYGKLLGLIYLENHQLTEAFTAARIKVLRIFAAQAAISLENSLLYTQLEQKVRERTEQLQKVNMILKERSKELAVAKENAETISRLLEKQNVLLQQEIIARKRVEEKQKQNLERLRQSEERFAKIFRNCPVMMSIKTLREKTYVDINTRWEKVTGYSKEEIIGFSDTYIATDTDDVLRQRDTQDIDRYAVKQIRTKSGDFRFFLISQTIVNLNNVDYWLTASLDITEYRKMEKELSRLDRLNLVGEMAASIGHEVRNPMTTVRGYLQMLKQQEEHSKAAGTFNLLIDELDRANTIITEFLSLARDRYVDLKRSNINTVVAAMQPLIEANAMARDMNVKVRLDKVPDILLDEKEIRQMLLNLSQNALEAMSPGGTLMISTYAGNNEVVLLVKDEGNGISREILEKIGTPFITTKETGTGLGLSVCYGIASRHGANIEIKTGKKGTTIAVRFPCC